MWLDSVDHVLVHIERGLRVKRLADPASRALNEITHYCRTHLTKYFQQLMGLLIRSEGLKEEEMEMVSKGILIRNWEQRTFIFLFRFFVTLTQKVFRKKRSKHFR